RKKDLYQSIPLPYLRKKKSVSLTPYGKPTWPLSISCSHVVPERPTPTAIKCGNCRGSWPFACSCPLRSSLPARGSASEAQGSDPRESWPERGPTFACSACLSPASLRERSGEGDRAEEAG